MKGTDFMAQIAGLPRIPDREDAILEAVRAGNTRPSPMVEVSTTWGGHVGTISVSSDVFAIGQQDDFVRVPVSGPTAQRIADLLGAVLPTTRISDLVWHAATLRLPPLPMGPPYDASMLSVARFGEHDRRIEQQRAGRGGLVAGHKKDIVLTERLVQRPKQVAIYGWHLPSGTPIQPLSLVHESTYADYSHGLRLVAEEMRVDGAPMRVRDVLRSPDLAGLLSAEGPLSVLRFPGVAPPVTAASTGSLGERATAVALQELQKGVREVPDGSNTGPDIRKYLAGCERGGRRLGLSSGNWCAAFACYCAFQAADAEDSVPHRWRAAVAEIWADALAVGAAHLADTYVPRVGDLAIYKRSGGDPTRGGIGHVGRVVRPPGADGSYETVEGNHENRVAQVKHTLGDAVGWVSYPVPAAPEAAVDEATLVRAAQLLGGAPPSDG